MSRKSASKQIVLFLIGSAVNILMFSLSKYAGFPFWLDFTGTFYIAALCGPVLAFLSLALHIVLLTVLIDGVVALWLALPIALVCAVIISSNNTINSNKKTLTLAPVIITGISCAFVGNFISFICSKTLPGRYFVYNAAFEAIWNSHSKFVASVVLSAGITICELGLSLILLIIMLIITPKNKDGLTFRK